MLLFVLLSADVVVFCNAVKVGVIADPCNGHGQCYGAAQCHCNEGYGPEASYADEALCACTGASKTQGCGPHGKCWADTEQPPQQQHTCECEAGYSGNMCEHGTGCDAEPCSHGTCTPDGENYTCTCTAGWRRGDQVCDQPTGCDGNPDCGHGICVASGGMHTCKCDSGYSGATCDHRCNLGCNLGCGSYAHCVETPNPHPWDENSCPCTACHCNDGSGVSTDGDICKLPMATACGVNYRPLDQPWRSVAAGYSRHDDDVPGFPFGEHCNEMGSIHTGVDRGWYQFVGEGGDAMANHPPGGDHCGSAYPFWFSAWTNDTDPPRNYSTPGVYPTAAQGGIDAWA
eukprot:COSAG01_NODE_2027_length_8600_cov_3.986356_1_plen_342_part_10